MAIDAEKLNSLIARELKLVSDTRVLTHIRGLLVEPKTVSLGWDYGEPGDQYPCWMVLEHSRSGTGIAFCEKGFGPRNPWGLVFLQTDDDELISMGMDSGWFPIFLQAYFESFASTDLPIWRVFKTDSSGFKEPISDENTWDSTWQRVEELRATDTGSRYDCGHSIFYQE